MTIRVGRSRPRLECGDRVTQQWLPSRAENVPDHSLLLSLPFLPQLIKLRVLQITVYTQEILTPSKKHDFSHSLISVSSLCPFTRHFRLLGSENGG